MIKRKQELSKTEARALAQCLRKVRTFYTLVGMTGLEPATSRPPDEYSTN